MLRERRWETSVSLREQPKASAPAMILRGRGGGLWWRWKRRWVRPFVAVGETRQRTWSRYGLD
ncbi:hypothetical protein OIU74_020993, partial [Salix koriyanagi]